MFLSYLNRSFTIGSIAISNQYLFGICTRPVVNSTRFRFNRPRSLIGISHITTYLALRQFQGRPNRRRPTPRMDFCEVPSISCNVPEWLNKEFVESTLQVGYKDPNLRIAFHEVTPATSPGDNYVSELYRVNIDLCNNGKHRSIIIKCLPTSEYNLKFIHDARLFEKEINFYDVTLPAMDISDLAPHCLLTRQDMLVLEDLSPMGFKMVNRHKGLDFDHCQVAVKSLARLHAHSVRLSQSDLIERYPETVYHDYDHAYRYINHSLTSLASVVATWPNFEHFSDIIRGLAVTVLDKVLELMPRSPPTKDLHLFGLNHGDYWTNNIMFRYNEPSNSIAEVRVLDYQMCRYAPLALDLQYLFSTSICEEDQTKIEDRLIQVYHTEFCAILKRDDHLTLKQLQEEMKRTEIFGFVNACMMLPVVLADPTEDSPDLGNVAKKMSNDVEILNWHKGAHFKRQFQKLLISYEKKGLFNGKR